MPLTRRLAIGALVVPALVFAAAASSALASSAHQEPAGVTAVDVRSGHALPDDPVIRAGEKIRLVAGGFAPQARVVVGLVGVGLFGSVVSDGAGQALYTYVVPESLRRGSYRLIFSGPVASSSARSGTSRPAAGVIQVTVPLVDQWPFRIQGASGARPSLGVSGAEQSRGAEHGPTSNTGSDVLDLLAVGLLAVGVGAL
ncbi:MAG TPA: hypothetical protein VKB75_02255, partial [Jatrophihabitans sp.]|nr:hypothetical protein [Jatrophihabitans sp.]